MLSELSRDFFSQSPMLFYPIVALGLFLAVFVAMLARTLFTRPEELDRLSRLPFDSEGMNQ